MLITGLRGVGKTVLLGAFESRARAGGWITVTAEITKNEDFGARMGSMVRRALFQVAPKSSWGEKLRRAAGALRSFSITVAPDGSITAGIDLEPLEGTADSGNLSDDLTDLLVVLGEAAEERDGIAFLVDEVQFLRANEFEALIAGLHRTVQRRSRSRSSGQASRNCLGLPEKRSRTQSGSSSSRGSGSSPRPRPSRRSPSRPASSASSTSRARWR